MDNKNVLHIHNKMYLLTKENEMMKFTVKCMELENIILNEVTRTQKGKY